MIFNMIFTLSELILYHAEVKESFQRLNRMKSWSIEKEKFDYELKMSSNLIPGMSY